MRLFSSISFSLMAVSLAGSAAYAQTVRWEPGKIAGVEKVSIPAKTADPSCRSVPRGEVLPAPCRQENLRAQQYWRVTVETGNRRLVVRPYRTPKLIETLNQPGPIYVEPKFAAGSAVEVAVYSNNSVRIRTDQGEGLPAQIETNDATGGVDTQVKPEAPPVSRPRAITAVPSAPSVSAPGVAAPQAAPQERKIVLLENGDFIDLEAQELKAQDIGDGAAVYSFAGDTSPVRTGSNRPVFLILGGNDGGAVEVSRLQVGKGSRQMVYSAVKKHSASALPVTVTQASDTLRKVTVNEPLAPGEYVILLQDSGRAFLFTAR